MRKFCLALAAIAIAGCTSDSQLPVATGKGSIRAINAVLASPSVSFLIEERSLGILRYGEASPVDSWDDFDYNFNFDIILPGDDETTRIFTHPLKVEADQEFTLVLTGTIDTPTVTVWQTPEREFAEGGTVFHARFSHLAESQGSLDYYFLPAGTPPVVGEQRGTLAFGEILDPLDIESGDYVLTVTAAGTPSTVVFQSDVESYASGTDLLVSLFDSNGQSTAPQRVLIYGQTGGIAALTDVRFPPTARFIHASRALAASDVYDDEMLTNLILANHQFGDITAPVDVAVGTSDFTYTAVGNISVVQFEFALSAQSSTSYNAVVIGDDTLLDAVAYIPDKRPSATDARFTLLHAAADQGFVDIYRVPRGEAITELDRILRGVNFGFLSSDILQVAGSYDVYVTTIDETDNVIAGPVELDLVLGDVVELLLLDTVDPNVSELTVIPSP